MIRLSHLSRVIALAFGVVASSLPILAQDDAAERVFQQAKTLGIQFAEETGPAYIFDIAMDLDDLKASATVDLGAEEGQRLVVHSPPADQWAEEFTSKVREYDKNVGEDLWCQRLMDGVGDYSTVALTPDGMVFDVTLKFDPDEKDEVKFSKNMQATVTLSADDGAVLGYTMHAPKPFRPVLVAKIKTFELSIECDRAPNGWTYAKHVRTNIEGRAMMKNFHQKESRSISNMRLP